MDYDKLIGIILEQLHITEEDFFSKRRFSNFVYARTVFSKIVYDNLLTTLGSGIACRVIAAKIKKDRTDIYHLIKNADYYMRYNKEFKALCEKIIDMYHGRYVERKTEYICIEKQKFINILSNTKINGFNVPKSDIQFLCEMMS